MFDIDTTILLYTELPWYEFINFYIDNSSYIDFTNYNVVSFNNTFTIHYHTNNIFIINFLFIIKLLSFFINFIFYDIYSYIYFLFPIPNLNSIPIDYYTYILYFFYDFLDYSTSKNTLNFYFYVIILITTNLFLFYLLLYPIYYFLKRFIEYSFSFTFWLYYSFKLPISRYLHSTYELTLNYIDFTDISYQDFPKISYVPRHWWSAMLYYLIRIHILRRPLYLWLKNKSIDIIIFIHKFFSYLFRKNRNFTTKSSYIHNFGLIAYYYLPRSYYYDDIRIESILGFTKHLSKFLFGKSINYDETEPIWDYNNTYSSGSFLNNKFFRYYTLLETYHTFSYKYIIIKNYLLFELLFIFTLKFIFFSLLKNVLQIGFLTKFIPSISFYIVNIYIYLNYIFSYFFSRYFLSKLINIQSYLFLYINMYLHRTVFEFITEIIYPDQYYTSPEFFDYFPLHQTTFIIYFSNWIKYKNSISFRFLFKSLNFCYLYFLTIFISFIDYLIKNVPFSFTVKYFFTFIRFSWFRTVFAERREEVFFFSIFLSILLYFIWHPLYVSSNFFLIYFIYYICNLIHNIPIRKHIPDFLYFLGYYSFLFFDTLQLFLKYFIKIFFFLFKYFLFYPFLLFCIISLWRHNPIIWVAGSFIFKFITLNVYYIILFIIHFIRNFFTYTLITHNFISLESKWLLEYILDINSSGDISNTILDSGDLANTYKWEYLQGDRKIYNLILWYGKTRNYLKTTVPLLIDYYYVNFMFLIYEYDWFLYLFHSYTYRHYITSMLWLLFTTYYFFCKYYYLYFIYRIIPLYIIQPYLYLIINFFEYIFIVKSFFFQIYFFKLIFFFFYYLNIYFYYSFIYKLTYPIYYFILNTYNILYDGLFFGLYNPFIFIETFTPIFYFLYHFYYFLFIDILNYFNLHSFCSKFLVYINLNFMYSFFWDPFFDHKFTFLSWLRFPYKNYIKINHNILKPFYFYERRLQWRRFQHLWDALYLAEKELYFYKQPLLSKSIWLYKYINNISLVHTPKYLYTLYKVRRMKKWFFIIPFLWLHFYSYLYFLFIFFSLFFIWSYHFIFSPSSELYYFNANKKHSWDCLTDYILYDNNKYLTNKKFMNYYHNELLYPKTDYFNESQILKESLEDMYDLTYAESRSHFNTVIWQEFMSAENLREIRINQIRSNKKKFIKVFSNYNNLKNKLIKQYNSKKLKFKNLYNNNLIIYQFINRFYVFNKLMGYSKFVNDILYDFNSIFFKSKEYSLFDQLLDNTSNTSCTNNTNKINIFFQYYSQANLDIYTKSIFFDYNFDLPNTEMFSIFHLPNNYYNYITNSYNKLLPFSRWFDQIIPHYIFPNILFFLHKDPSLCFIGKDSNDIKYYLHDVILPDNNSLLYELILLGIPLLLLFLHSGYLLTILHNEYGSIWVVYKQQIILYIVFVLTQFEASYVSTLKLLWGLFEKSGNIIWDWSDFCFFFSAPKLTWYLPSSKKVFKLFPLYIYTKREFNLTFMYSAPDVVGPFENVVFTCFKHLIVCSIFNLFNFFYIKFFNIFDFYSYKLLYLFFFKILIFIFLFIIIKTKFTILNFYMFNNYSLNFFDYSLNIRNRNYNSWKKFNFFSIIKKRF